MGLDTADVLKIAELARLALSDEEAASLVTDLTNILDLVAQMDMVDAAEVEPMAHPLEMNQRLRPDAVTEPNRREEFQAIAPLTEQGLYLVPKVIE